MNVSLVGTTYSEGVVLKAKLFEVTLQVAVSEVESVVETVKLVNIEGRENLNGRKIHVMFEVTDDPLGAVVPM